MTAPPASPAPSLPRRWWPVLLVAVVAVGVFADSFNNEFIYDDRLAIVQNTYIRSWYGLWELVNPTSTYHRGYWLLSYRPLQNISFLVTYQLFGLDAGSHHIFNVVLHALNAVLVFAFLRRLTRNDAVALVGALAFAVHPIHMEAVQVSGLRADLLATPFFLAALLCHLRLRDRPHHSPLVWAGLAAASYFLACTGKEMGATVPLVALFLDARRHKPKALLSREGIRPYLGYAAAAALYGWLRFGLFSNIHQGDAYLGGSPLAALLTTGRIFVYYLDHLLLPFNIRPEYFFTPSRGLDAASAGAWALLAALAWVAWLARRRHPTLTLGLVWLGVTLLPVANLVPIRNPMGDRYLYLPSVGFCAIVGWAVVEGSRAAKERWGALGGRAVAMLCASVLIAWGAIAWTQNAIWRNDITLWSETLRLEPDSAQAHNIMGVVRWREGRYAEAEPLLKRALAIWEKALGPGHILVASILYNLAELYLAQDQYAKAEPLHKQALAIWENAQGPDHSNVAQSLNSLAALYQAQGQYAKAEPLFKRALGIEEKALGPDHPNVAQSLNSLAALYFQQGQYPKAESLYKRALAIWEKTLGSDHHIVSTLYDLAQLSQLQGQYAKAESLYKRALAIDEKGLGLDHPNVATMLNNLAVLYFQQGQDPKAEPLFKRALGIREKALGPDHPSVATSLINLAELYRAQGLYAEAEPLFKRALAIREKVLGLNHPRLATTLSNLALLYHAQGQYAQAEPLYKRALSILEKTAPNNPKIAATLENLAELYVDTDRTDKARRLIERADRIRTSQ